jgi:hypothetical protein
MLFGITNFPTKKDLHTVQYRVANNGPNKRYRQRYFSSELKNLRTFKVQFRDAPFQSIEQIRHVLEPVCSK